MKTSRKNQSEGIILLELLVVVAIIGALSSIAIPRYATYRDKAKTAACSANRRNMEIVEATYFSEHGAPSLEIKKRYACPTGGVYVWLVSDSDDPDYPKVGCSIHFAGSGASSTQPPSTTTSTTSTTFTTTTSTTTSTTPTTTTIPPADNNPVSRIESLIDHIPSLNLTKKIEKQLISTLSRAAKELDKGQASQAMKTLNSFIEYVEKQKGKTITEKDAEELVLIANEIIDMIE